MTKKPLEFYANHRGCWICCSHINRRAGYSMIKRHGKTKELHRYMYEKHIGKIPKGMCALHTCDNPSCNNPDHLFLGTHNDNMQDKKNKDRQAKGIQIKRGFLTEDQVREIYFSEGTHRMLAHKYGVTHSCIYNIKHKKTWKHLWKDTAKKQHDARGAIDEI